MTKVTCVLGTVVNEVKANDYFNLFFKFNTCIMIEALYDKSYVPFRLTTDVPNFVQDLEVVLKNLEDVENLDVKIKKITSYLVNDLDDKGYFNVFKNTIEKLYSADHFVPTTSDKYIMWVLADIADNFIENSEYERFRVNSGLLNSLDLTTKLLSESELNQMSAFYDYNITEFIKKILFSAQIVDNIFDTTKDLHNIIVNQQYYENMSLDEMLLTNKSFKEINKIYKNPPER